MINVLDPIHYLNLNFSGKYWIYGEELAELEKTHFIDGHSHVTFHSVVGRL